MRKGTKSDLLSTLVGETDIAKPNILTMTAEEPTVFLVDAMAFIQHFQHLGARTFGELASLYLTKFLEMMPAGCTHINIVGDRYDFKHSLKADERHRRCTKKSSREFVPADNIHIPDWKESKQESTTVARQPRTDIWRHGLIRWFCYQCN